MTHRSITATHHTRRLPGIAGTGVPASTTTITTTGTTIPMVRTGVSS
ncbi:hypothetical protein [Lysobacter olei]